MSNKWNTVAVNELYDGAAHILTAMTGIADDDERSDLIRRQLAIVFQIAQLHGATPTKSFEDHVKDTIAETDEARERGLAMGIF